MLALEPQTFRWTRADYHETAETGIFDGRRVELIGGEIVEMAPQRDQHALAIMLADEALREAFTSGYAFRIQMPLAVSAESEPEPDLAVVKGSTRSIKRHPRTASLIIEVSDTTLAFDRQIKASLYASASVRDYWILNLVQRQLEIHRKPVRSASHEFGHSYSEIKLLTAGDSVSPLAAPRSKIKVADLLP